MTDTTASPHTFVIMAYKNAPFLEETIKSILNQTHRSEVCLSTSTLNERIQSLADKYNLPLYVNQPGQGIAKDWTFAINCAKTPLVTLADQDDFYFPDFSRNIVDKVERNPDAIVCFTHFKEIDDDRKIRPLNLTMAVKYVLLLPYFIRTTYRSRFFKRLTFRFGEPICNPSVTYNMAVIKDHMLFDENYSVSLDWDALLRLTDLKGAFCFIRKPMILHGIHTGTQTSFGITSGKRFAEDLHILQRLWPVWIAKLLAKAYSVSYFSNH
jgi:glycosyltransferase involved in cell wall biosynthesis